MEGSDPRDWLLLVEVHLPLGLVLLQDIYLVIMNSPVTFQRTQGIILSAFRFNTFLLHMDDVIVFIHDFRSHINHVWSVFVQATAGSSNFKSDQSYFFPYSVQNLGHSIRP